MTDDISTPGTVISFYSYKGGTGRTMAVANAACLIAKEGARKSQRVLVVDWDLEAPGLHSFFSSLTGQLENQPGIINYFMTLQELLRGSPNLYCEVAKENGWKCLSEALPIDDYIILEVESGVDLLPAGRLDSDYSTLVGTFSWVDFYTEFRSAITAFRKLLQSKYRYCLIDSRTGLSDIGGICTALLPEKLVTVFTPNSQSQSGILNVIKDAIDYRRASDDYRPLSVFPLPSRIDLAEIELKKKWRHDYQQAFENCFREAYEIEECDLTAYFDEVQLPHVSYYAYGEQIAVLREQRSEAFSLSRAYQEFLQRLLHLNHVWETTSSLALHQLRAPVLDFVGREHEIQALINALRQDSSTAVIALCGMGGIGKTELALLAAERLSNDYPDAQFFINLQGTDPNPSRPQEVMANCVRAFLGADETLPEDPAQLSQLYRSLLSGKRVLLLLDNAADSGQVLPLLPPSGSALLVTSRQALALPGMKSLWLNLLTAEEAKQLLLTIAPHAEPAAEQICVLCGYLPLAIRAAASLLAITLDLDPIEYASQLSDERHRLERIGTQGVDIDVAASLNLSYVQLESQTARVFRILSVFAGTFDAAAEEVICSDKGHQQLTDLVRRSLVVYEASTKRYRLHDLARLFAETKLSAQERAVGLKRHATHYQEVLAVTNDLYVQGGNALARGLALFDLEWGNIQAGHAWATTQGLEVDDEVARLCIAYANAGVLVLKLRQHSRDRIHWYELSLATARRLKDETGESIALANLGEAFIDLGETKRAIQFYEQHQALARALGDRQREATAQRGLGVAYYRLGETQRAIQFYEQHLSMARSLGDRRGESQALGDLGLAYADLGEIQRAIQFYEQQLSIVREIADRRNEGIALGNLGLAYYSVGDIRRAMEFYEHQLTIVREIGDRRGEGIALGNLGTAYYSLGDIRRAMQFYEHQLTIVREIGDRRGEGNALGGLGVVHISLGENQQAIQFYEQQLTIVREIGDRRSESTARWNMSLALNQLGKRTQAIEHAKQSLIIREEIEDPRAAKVRAKLATWRLKTKTS
jgi:tetratricopeptide (TPR) repeat protein